MPRALLLALVVAMLGVAPAHAEVTVTGGTSSLVEGDSGQRMSTYTVSTDQILGETVTVAVSGAGATANPSSVAVGGLNGDGTVTVSIPGDSVDEADATVTVTFSGSSEETRTIAVDDDDTSLIATPVALAEGAGSATGFTVAPAKAVPKAIGVTADVDGGTATKGTDFTAVATPLTWAANDTTAKAVPISVVQDALDEDDETVALALSALNGVAAPSSTATTAIADDDAPPLVGVIAPKATAPEALEGDAVGKRAFGVVLSAPSGRAISVPFGTFAASATPGSDYAQTTGTLTFNPGETQKSVEVAVIGDKVVEADEAFGFSLGEVVNATVASTARQAAGVLLNDDVAGVDGGVAGPGTATPGAPGGGPSSVLAAPRAPARARRGGASGDDRAPRVRIDRVRRSGGRLIARVRCVGERRCSVRLAAFTLPASREVRIARTALTLRGSTPRTLRLRLRGAGRASRARVYVVATDAAGNVATTSAPLRLR